MRFETRNRGVALSVLAVVLVATVALARVPDRVEKKIDVIDTVWIWALEADGERIRVVTRGHDPDGDMGPIAESFVIDEHTVVRSGKDLIEPTALAIGDRVVIEATEEPDIPKGDEEPQRIAREILVVVDPPRPQNETPE